MKIRHIFLLLLVQLMCSCGGKAENGFTIAPPSNKPNTGQQTGNENGNGNSGGNENGGGTENPPATEPKDGFIVVGYATYWDTPMPNPTLLTHINYAFAHIKSDFESLDIQSPSRLTKIAGLKKTNPNLKVLLSVGGWEAGNFSEMAASDTHRKKFCSNCAAAVKNYNLDGIDLDWEYPTSNAAGISSSPDDTKNFNLVLQELRETIGTDKIISYASSSSHPEYVDWPTAIKYIDYVNVMTYDMGAAPKGHNSPLHKGDRFTHSSWDEAIQKHVKAGIPKNRMVMGVPFYGKAEKSPADADKVFVDSKGKLGYSIKYKDIVPVVEKGTYMGVALNRKLHRVWDPKSMVPFLADDTGRNFLSYDDPESVTAKGKYVTDNSLLGAMFWEYRGDTQDHGLLKPLVKAIYGKESVLQ